ncbi:DUF2806 domain-containing protein [Psychrobacter sp. BI730]|uniref:DUF2806 domain-containing protein n=1 Tax=Psychrobacter sp. BI730 TaxID=2705463 RepID=UPI0015C82AE2|nr:DUF2806 domain-containing protein [Psychrobacter sp. BI730]NYR09180.1 DUF2806 domain-containing protein [Psychrobacter sp. BI730]
MQMPGEVLLLKMWETLIEKGIGGLIYPYYTVWKNKKLTLGAIELDKISRIAISEGEKEIAELNNNEINLIGYESTASVENESGTSVRDTVLSHDIKRLIRAEINVVKAINHANGRLIEDVSDLPKEEVSQDWLNTWRDNASKVTDEEVQSLWGNILAQEFLEPGRYSLRLLEFLKTMSKSDALLVEKLAPYYSELGIIYGRVTEGSFVASNDNFLEASKMTRGELNLLEEIGIISGVSTLGVVQELLNIRKVDEAGFLSFILVSEKALMISSKSLNENVKLLCYKVTKVGKEVLSLITYETKPSHLKWLADQLTDDYQVTICEKIDNNFKPIFIFND